MVVKQFLLDLC